MNPKISNLQTEILSQQRFVYKKITYDYEKADGTTEQQTRVVFDRGNGAAILLYNSEKKTIILTRQFRLPAFLNQSKGGMLIEVCAGTLEEANPEECIKREAEEETGYRINEVKKVFEAYMSPGAMTEILYFFTAEYMPEMKVSEGGGLEEEHEYIEVLEMRFNKAYEMILSGEIVDAKTIMLIQHLKIQGVFD
ncbi:MAG: NUDIX domain-containing protein [Flavobacteriaceae bacterium]|jgi:nudix-type nucleoside diphosphatase (YffH/AdpP family)|nr:NUDIX domain-containing protein [Flavobacteriaceae bacterium]